MRYGQTHHFKRLHDSIGGAVKRNVYLDVSASKVIIKDVKHFHYADSILKIKFVYLDSLKKLMI